MRGTVEPIAGVGKKVNMYFYHDVLILRSMQYCIYSSAIVLHIIFKVKIFSTTQTQ